jgi:hypothetical protein
MCGLPCELEELVRQLEQLFILLVLLLHGLPLLIRDHLSLGVI